MMPNNISVAITADVAGLQVGMAKAKAELAAAQKDLNAYVRTARTAGETPELRAGMLAAGDAVAKARGQVKLLTGEMAHNTEKAISNRAATESLILVHEALRHNYTRMVGSASIMAQAFAGEEGTAKALAAVMSPLGLTVIGLGAALIGTAVATYQYDAAQRQLTAASLGAAAASGLSADQMEAAAETAASASGITVGAARQAATAFAEAGVSDQQTLTSLSESVSTFAALTGEKASKAVETLAKAMKDPAKGARDLNDQLGFLDATELQQIQTLSDLGDKTDAQARLTQDLTQYEGEANAAAGGLTGGFYEMAAQASLLATWIGKVNDELGILGNLPGLSGLFLPSYGGNKAAQRALQDQAQLDQADTTALGVTQGMSSESAERAALAKKAAELRAGMIAAKTYGETGQYQADAAALAEVTQAMTGYVSAAEAKHRLNQLEIQDLGAKTPAQKAAIAAEREQLQVERERSQGHAVSAEEEQQRMADAGAKARAEAAAHHARGGHGGGAARKAAEEQKRLDREAYQDHVATLNDTLEADRDNWAKEKADWAQKLDFIKAKFGEESHEYKDAYRQLEAAERDHEHTMQQIQRDARRESLEELRSDLATERTLREDAAREAESLVRDRAQYSGNPLARVQAEQQVAAIQRQAMQQQIADAGKAYVAEDNLRTQAVVDALAKYGQDSQAYAQAVNAKKLADQEWANQKKALLAQSVTQELQAAQRVRQAWHGMIDPMVQTTGNQIKGLIEGTETWGQALRNIGEEALSLVVDAIERMVEEWIVNMVVGKTATTTTALSQVASYSAVAGAAGIASWAAAPWPIDMGAPAFGAAMAADAAAYGAMASLDVGTNYVPSDMVAQIHEGERIMPAADNSRLMSMMAGTTNNSRGGDFHGDFGVTVHSGGGSADVVKALEGQQARFAKLLKNMHRNGHFAFARA
jgi:hypothetical protein